MLAGAFESTVMEAMPLFTGAAMFGIVIVAGYLLFAMQRSLFRTYRRSAIRLGHPKNHRRFILLGSPKSYGRRRY
ncbi:hypothetical protein C9J85_10380 [Haloferax sp. wsp5]|nr:hypothetical protein C9J85_10380 [Haloferax sp. wsp5]